MAGWALLRFAMGMYLALQSRIAHSMKMEHLHRAARLSSRGALHACRHDSFDEPEAASVQVLCHLGGRCVPATVDTAAQVSVMSAECVRRLRLSQYVDARYNGKAVGVGTQDITGEIRNLPIRIGSAVVFPRIAVLRSRPRPRGSEEDDSTNTRLPDFLIGMDVLRRHKAEISLNSQTLRLQGANGRTHVIPLLDRAATLAPQHRTEPGTDSASDENEQHATHASEGTCSTQRHRQLDASGLERRLRAEQELMAEEIEAEEQISLEGF